jgi:hypothetical protein
MLSAILSIGQPPQLFYFLSWCLIGLYLFWK